MMYHWQIVLHMIVTISKRDLFFSFQKINGSSTNMIGKKENKSSCEKKKLLFGDENSISNFWNWNSWGLPPFYLIELRWQQKCIEFFELCCCCSPLIRGACLRFEFFPQKIIIVVVVHLFPFFFNSSLLLHFWCIFQKIQSKNTICK